MDFLQHCIINVNTVLCHRNILYTRVITSRNISDFKIVGHTVSWLAEDLEHLEKIIQYKFQSEIFFLFT